MYTVFHFLWYFPHGISETWIPLVFIFSWLWPQLYYLFRVFSIVNIYKTLNKLFNIAFHNLCLHASRMRGTEKSQSDSPCVTEHVNSLSNHNQEHLVLSSFFFKSPKSLWGLETYKGMIASQSGETVDSGTLLPLPSLSPNSPSLCSSFPLPLLPQWTLRTISSEKLVHKLTSQ